MPASPLGDGKGRSTERRSRHRIAELARESLARGQNLHHPHYVGHQVPAPVPLAALFDLVGSATNQVMAIYEMGPWATAVEHAVIDAVGETLGFRAGPVRRTGHVRRLGRQSDRPADGAQRGARRCLERRPRRAATGAGARRPRRRPLFGDALGRHSRAWAPIKSSRPRSTSAAGWMPNRLDDTLADLRARGVPIIAVSAAACATPIGAFDPLAEIAEVCRRHDVWLHVDAAHGGALAFSARHRHLLAGIEQADSVVCDAHKMMFMPALCAMLFYRNREHRIAAFHQDAPYLFDPTAPELAEYDSGIVNLECTKRAAAFGVWGIWSLFGPQLFADMVDVTIDLAQQFHALLRRGRRFRAAARAAVQHRGVPLLAGGTARRARRANRRRCNCGCGGR